MPYNPGVTDISGQILGRGIAQFGQSIGGAIGDYAKEKATAAEKLDFLTGQMETMAQFSPDLVTAEMMDKFHAASIGGKQAIVSELGVQQKRMQDLEDLQKRHELSRSLAAFKSGLSGGGGGMGGPQYQPVFTEMPGGTLVTNPRLGTNLFLPLPEAEAEGPAAPVIETPLIPGTNARMILEDGKYKGTITQTPDPSAPSKAVREALEPETRADPALFNGGEGVDEILNWIQGQGN